jgi:nitrous oxide reductase
VLSGALGQAAGSASAAVSPQQASQITPAQVQEIATHAEQHSPGIVDQLSQFYAQHTGLVQTLGSAALAIALAHMANRTRG